MPYRVKGTIGELQQGAIAQGDRIRLTSRVDSSKTWLGTVTLVDYENPVKNDNNGYNIGSSDSSNMASKYPFYVELDSVEGLIMGQHLYMERYTEGDDEAGVIVSSAYLCYEDDGSAYVWAENSRSKLESGPSPWAPIMKTRTTTSSLRAFPRRTTSPSRTSSIAMWVLPPATPCDL